MSTTCNVGGIDEDKNTVMYFDGMDGEEKLSILNDINTQWRKRVVMTNTEVNVGLDINVRWFHRMFACALEFRNPREILQWLSTARHIIDTEVFVVKNSPFLRPKRVPELIDTNPVYTNLIKSYNTELQTSTRTVLECFAFEVGYAIKTD
jgi:hypothetical protein